MSKPIRITELSTMGRCEKQWQYRYVLDHKDEGSVAMTKGTLLHAMYAAWWKNGQPESVAGLEPEVIEHELDDDRKQAVKDMPPIEIDNAFWLFDRFCKVYGGTNHFELVASEVELEAEVDGLLLQGRADAIVREVATGNLYLGECKSMKDWRRLDILEVDPQVTHYYLLCHQAGYDVKGVMYDALKTYRWKRDEHPPEDSVQRLYIHRTAEQCEASLSELHAFSDRRDDIVTGKRIPLRNISHLGSCNFCSFRSECWEDLAFPETKIVMPDE